MKDHLRYWSARLRCAIVRWLNVPMMGAVAALLAEQREALRQEARREYAANGFAIEHLRKQLDRLDSTVRMMALASAKRDVEEMEAKMEKRGTM